MKTGRPRLVNLQSDAQRFLDLYLDPLNSPEEICRLSGIKKSTFYNYEKELNLPQIKVGFGISTGNLPRELALTRLVDPDEVLELKIIQQLSKDLSARIKIIAFDTSSGQEDDLLDSKKVDFLLASVSKTKSRTKNFYFSDHHFYDGGPFGVLISNPENELNLKVSRRKPILGVVQASIHAEYASANFQHEFDIKYLASGKKAMAALLSGTVDFVLANPSWVLYRELKYKKLEIKSKKIIYSGAQSGIVFHNDSMDLIPEVNRSLGIFYEKNKL